MDQIRVRNLELASEGYLLMAAMLIEIKSLRCCRLMGAEGWAKGRGPRRARAPAV